MRKRKILIIGKKNHIGWCEYVRNAFLANDCDVEVLFTNQLPLYHNIKKGLYKILNNKKLEISLQVDRVDFMIKNFKPDMVFFVSAFFSDILLYECCKEHNILTTGWVGDKFGIEKSIYANFIDFLFVSDSSFVKHAQEIGFEDVELLQFGYDKNIHKNLNLARRDSINFVGSYTKERDDTLSQLLDYEMEIYGYKWDRLSNISKNWTVSNKKISQKRVANIYNSTVATLNVAQKENVVNMVNTRTFEAIACGSCMINDCVKDLELCFEEGKEVLVYHDFNELKELVSKVQNDKKFVRSIILNACNRVEKSRYSYADRIENILKICDL